MPNAAGALLKKRYRLIEVIGKGGMAYVYRALDTALNREVAVKLFVTGTNEELVQRHDDEVAILASLNHHGLVTLFDAGVERPDRKNLRAFFVMELVTGADLRRTITAGPIAPRDIAIIGYDIAEALLYLHSRDVVHRDIKPSNILFVDYYDDGERARAKLTDFGIAHRGIEEFTGDGATTGTAAYLSPEQVAREPVGPPSDIYALGLVLLECFTRKVAYPGDPVESALARLERQPAIPSRLPAEWRSLLARMTAREPRERPTAKELMTELRQLIVNNIVAEPARQGHPVEPPKENPFDRITAIAARVLNAPIAIMSVVDSGRRWLIDNFGIDLAQIQRDTGHYTSANLYKAAWIPENASSDPSVLADPGVAKKLGLGFYASAPLIVRDGTQIGVLCVLDFEKRKVGEAERSTLEDLASMAMAEFELRLEQYMESQKA